MRLSSHEINQLKEAIQELKPPSDLQLVLYGSRVRDDLKGGGIDLAIIVPDGFLDGWKAKKLDLLVKFKQRIGEQKIDLSIITENQVVSDSFFKVALSQSVLIHKW